MRCLVLLAALVLPLLPGTARADDWVYCARGQIEIDGRDPEQMRIARGSSLCQMGPRFGFRMDAQSFAEKNFGGPGKPCSCR